MVPGGGGIPLRLEGRGSMAGRGSISTHNFYTGGFSKMEALVELDPARCPVALTVSVIGGKWKPTILYWAFGLILVGGRLAGRNLLRTVMGGQLTLPDPVWDRLNWIWTGYFAVMGALNLIVAFNFDTATWVNFKLFGTLALTVLFVIGQGIYLSRHLKEGGDVEAS